MSGWVGVCLATGRGISDRVRMLVVRRGPRGRGDRRRHDELQRHSARVSCARRGRCRRGDDVVLHVHSWPPSSPSWAVPFVAPRCVGDADTRSWPWLGAHDVRQCGHDALRLDHAAGSRLTRRLRPLRRAPRASLVAYFQTLMQYSAGVWPSVNAHLLLAKGCVSVSLLA